MVMRILYVSSWFPHPPDNGSRLRIFNLLKGLSPHYQVTLLAFTDRLVTQDDLDALGEICERVETVPWKEYQSNTIRARVGLLGPTPRSLVDTYSREMDDAIRRHLDDDYDAIICAQISLLPYSHLLQDQKALFEEVELASIHDQFYRSSGVRKRLRHGLTWFKTSRYVASHLRHFRACTVVSNREREILALAAPRYDSVEVIPNCVDLVRYQHTVAQPQLNSLIFSGAISYSANRDAVCFFLSDIYPIIRKEIPNIRMRITGKQDGVSLPRNLNYDGVDLLGYVPDIRSAVGSSWISLVPLRVGGGTRLKILESMALGTPVVSTSKGAEGLDVENGKHLLIADEPRQFALAVIRLLRDANLRAEIASNGRQLVKEKYDWAKVMPRFLDLVERVATSRDPRSESPRT